MYLNVIGLCLVVWCLLMLMSFVIRRWNQKEREQMKRYIQAKYAAPSFDDLDGVIGITRQI